MQGITHFIVLLTMLRLQVCSPVYLMAYLLPSESFLVFYFPHLTTCLWPSGTIYTRKTYVIFRINMAIEGIEGNQTKDFVRKGIKRQ